MPTSVEDMQMLRLIKAFQKITHPDLRRSIVVYAEEQLEKQQKIARQKLGRTEH